MWVLCGGEITRITRRRRPPNGAFDRMRHELDIDLIFPIKDEISAALMCLKAELLFQAGIIDADEISAVIERAAAVLDQLPKEAA
jgi:hypothetical protein